MGGVEQSWKWGSVRRGADRECVLRGESSGDAGDEGRGVKSGLSGRKRACAEVRAPHAGVERRNWHPRERSGRVHFQNVRPLLFVQLYLFFSFGGTLKPSHCSTKLHCLVLSGLGGARILLLPCGFSFRLWLLLIIRNSVTQVKVPGHLVSCAIFCYDSCLLWFQKTLSLGTICLIVFLRAKRVGGGEENV